MLKILLLDCSDALSANLRNQGFDVESGTVGICTGARKLPSQVYEKTIFFYNPESSPSDGIVRNEKTIINETPQFDLAHLQSRIDAGATVVAFLNPLFNNIGLQQIMYSWIPYMPPLAFSSDKIVFANRFTDYPDSEQRALAPVVATPNLSLPVLLKLTPPQSAHYPADVFSLYWNANGDCLGVQILRRRGRLILLPKFKSNEEMIEVFLHRVAPQLYDVNIHTVLSDSFSSPAEIAAQELIAKLGGFEKELAKRQEQARVQLAAAIREKQNIIDADPTAKQILIYHDYALRQEDVALHYLYKIVEAIENKFGGERAAIEKVGAGAQWKAVKKLANESYRDARHAPKPGDVIKKWTHAEISECFRNTEVVVRAYFNTLFPNAEAARGSEG